MSKVRLLIVGAGKLANEVHYPSLTEIQDVEIVAVCDLTEARLQETADKYGIEKRYSDYRLMFQQEQADAVYILMPPLYHFDIVLAALSHKLHVFLEKPPAITSFQMETFVRQAQKHGVFGMVGFNRRYMPMVQYAMNYLQEHAAAGLSQVVATFYKRRGSLFFNGGMDALMADGIHAVDFLRYAAGIDQEITELYSVSGRYDDVMDNAWNAVMTFANGATGILQTNYNVGGRLHTFELHTPDISLFVNPDEELTIIHNNKKTTIHTKTIAESEEFRKYYGFHLESKHFIESVRLNRRPQPDFEDALKTMQLVDRIKQGGDRR